MQININRKKVQGFQISPFQLIFTDVWLLKDLQARKTGSHLLKKNHSLDIARP